MIADLFRSAIIVTQGPGKAYGKRRGTLTPQPPICLATILNQWQDNEIRLSLSARCALRPPRASAGQHACRPLAVREG